MYQGIWRFFTFVLLILALSPVFATPELSAKAFKRHFPNDAMADTIAPASAAGPEDPVYYDASDSTVVDVINQRIFLYNNAVVKYGTMELRAAYIEFSFRDFTARAKGIPDSTGVLQGRPVFKEGENELTEDSLAYNFHTKRGISYGVRTQQGGAYLISNVSKRQSNEWIHVKGGMLTTCDHEKPHYHFRLSKAIVVPDDKVVSGPLYMRVGKVPTPVALPFGFFPNKRESAQGILLPGYGKHETKGFFLQNLGYYIPLPPHMDTKFLFDIYSNGSWRASNSTRYKKIYKYTGNFDISKSTNISGIKETSSYLKANDFAIGWNHQQDSKARPGTSFNALVKLGSRNNYRNNLNSSQQDYLSSTFNSSVQWSRSWRNRYTLGVSGRHTQNISTGQVDITLPSMSFTVNRFMLPVSKLFGSDVVKTRWYDQIGVNYAADFDNLLTTGDSLIRWNNMEELWGKTNNGLRQSVNASTSFKWFRGIVVMNPAFSYQEYWGFKTPAYSYDDSNIAVKDTINDFITGRNWNLSANANTRVYATYTLKKGNWLKAVRHVLFPTFGVGYTPYYNLDEAGFYGENNSLISWNPFDVSRFPPSNTQESASLNFGLKQNLEAKFRDRTSAKPKFNKVTLVDQFNITSRYNMIADSLNWSNIAMNANTTILKKYAFSYRSSYSLYDRDSLGREVNEFLWDTQNKVMRMEATSFSLDIPLAGGQKKTPTDDSALTPEEKEMLEKNKGQFADFSIPWSLSVNYNLGINKVFDTELQRDESVVTQGVTFRGDVTLFKRWKLGVDSGYDFELKDFTATVLSLNWDLHCWEFNASWIPTGERKSYMFQLNIKSPLLRDMKLQQRGQYGGQTMLY